MSDEEKDKGKPSAFGYDGPWDDLDLAQRNKVRKQIAFLGHYARMPTISQAADKIGAARSTITQWMKDPWFKQAMKDCEERMTDKIEAVAIDGAVNGFDEVLTFQGNITLMPDPETGIPVPTHVKKMVPQHTQFMLKSRRADTYGDRSKVNVEGAGPVLVVPGVSSVDDWKRMAKEHQAQYSGNTDMGDKEDAKSD